MSKQMRSNAKRVSMIDQCKVGHTQGGVEGLQIVPFVRYELNSSLNYKSNVNFQRYELNSMLHGFNYFVEGFENVLAMNYALISNLDVMSLEFVHTTRVSDLVYVDMCECCMNSIGEKSYLLEWLVLTFGLANVCNTFMGFMGCVLHASMGNFVVIYFDFILVYIKNFNVHVEYYRVMLIMLYMKFLSHEHVRKLNVFRAIELVLFIHGVSPHRRRVLDGKVIKCQQGKKYVVVTTLSQRYVFLSTLFLKFLWIENVKELNALDNNLKDVFELCLHDAHEKFYVSKYLFKENKFFFIFSPLHDLFDEMTCV
ncbi:uncharacterized protein [Henckelia pumila]